VLFKIIVEKLRNTIILLILKIFINFFILLSLYIYYICVKEEVYNCETLKK